MRAPRYPFDISIQIYWGPVSFEARTYNASQSGLFIETTTPLWIGATFSAELMVEPRVILNCRVVRIEPNRGMGVEISFPEQESESRFVGLIADLSPQTVETL